MMEAAETQGFSVIWSFMNRCAPPDSGLITDMWPILCLCTEVLRDWASLTGNQYEFI